MSINIKSVMDNFFRKDTNELTQEDIVKYKTEHKDEYDSSILRDPYIIQINSNNENILLYKKHNNETHALELFAFDSFQHMIMAKTFIEGDTLTKNIDRYCIAKDSSFAIVVSTYYSDNPHTVLDLYVFNNSCNEVFHTLCTSIGIDALTFSENALYFSAFVGDNLIIIDMNTLCVFSFEPFQVNKCIRDTIKISETDRNVVLQYKDSNTSYSFSGIKLEETT